MMRLRRVAGPSILAAILVVCGLTVAGARINVTGAGINSGPEAPRRIAVFGSSVANGTGDDVRATCCSAFRSGTKGWGQI